jgi:hypothetical protein
VQASGQVTTTGSTTLGFYGATPVTRPASADQAAAVYVTQTISVGYVQAEVQSINDGLVSVKTLVNQLRSDLVTLGLIKGSA